MFKYICYLFLLIFIFSCNKENSTEAILDHDSQLFGSWILTTAKINGTIIDSTQYDEIPVKMIFKEDGSGTFIEENGSSESITWYTSGNQLKIDDEVSVNYAVLGNFLTLSLTDTSDTVELVYTKEAEKEHDSNLIGTWLLTEAKVNGEVIDSTQYGEIPIKVSFGADGSGLFIEGNGISESIIWYTSSNQLHVDDDIDINYLVTGSLLKLTVFDGSDLIELTYSKQ